VSDGEAGHGEEEPANLAFAPASCSPRRSPCDPPAKLPNIFLEASVLFPSVSSALSPSPLPLITRVPTNQAPPSRSQASAIVQHLVRWGDAGVIGSLANCQAHRQPRRMTLPVDKSGEPPHAGR